MMEGPDKGRQKVIVVMPAYNAAKTLRITYDAMPMENIDHVILVDDGSNDETLKIAKELKLEVFVHARNFGYGANQKTCYTEALKAGADIVVMLHPDYQYDPALLPQVIAPIKRGVQMSCWDRDCCSGMSWLRACLGGNSWVIAV